MTARVSLLPTLDTAELAELRDAVFCVFPTIRVGLLHGRVYLFDAMDHGIAVSCGTARAKELPGVVDAVVSGLRKGRHAVTSALVFDVLTSPAAARAATALDLRGLNVEERRAWTAAVARGRSRRPSR